MTALKIFIFGAWAVFWLYWLISAVGVKQRSSGSRRIRPVGLLIILVGGSAIRLLRGSNGLAVHSPAVQGVGAIAFVAGLGLAVWARVRSWPQLGNADDRKGRTGVTSGPYRFVRHPIYSGILLAMLGTALATNLYFLFALTLALAYFVYSASVEERLLSASFPDAYPRYRAHTKMLIPFVL